ncbi:MAG: SRPBCC domain-containing protein [Bacteroidota bacterium]|nr:SRPBCC domain-containing protein [Bacteroidota bacterium]
MKKIKFATTINVPAEKVWNVLFNDETYRLWTSVFCEGSHAVSDWKEGSKILFMDGNKAGMSSLIAKKDKPTFMSFKHIGEIKDGNELPKDEKTTLWSGAMENYSLKEVNSNTELTVEVDLTEEHIGYFQDAFPKGLAKVKELSEN